MEKFRGKTARKIRQWVEKIALKALRLSSGYWLRLDC